MWLVTLLTVLERCHPNGVFARHVKGDHGGLQDTRRSAVRLYIGVNSSQMMERGIIADGSAFARVAIQNLTTESFPAGFQMVPLIQFGWWNVVVNGLGKTS
jgi:hypothetical protein